MPAAGWEFTDAWVLVAVDGTSAGNPSDLGSLVARADAIEHSSMTSREFRTGAGRLIAAGVLATDGERFWLTEAGVRLCDERRGRGSWSESLLVGLRKLGPPTGEPLHLPEGFFRRAVG